MRPCSLGDTITSCSSGGLIDVGGYPCLALDSPEDSPRDISVRLGDFFIVSGATSSTNVRDEDTCE